MYVTGPNYRHRQPIQNEIEKVRVLEYCTYMRCSATLLPVAQYLFTRHNTNTTRRLAVCRIEPVVLARIGADGRLSQGWVFIYGGLR